MSWRHALLAALFFAACAAPLSAQQDDELRQRELIAKIRKEMARIDELLVKVDEKAPREAPEAMREAASDIDKLLEDVRGRQLEVVESIEELIRLAKVSECKSGAAGECDQSGGGQGGSERGKDPEPEELKPQGQPAEAKPADQPREDPHAADREPEDASSRGKLPPAETGKFEREDLSGRWGVLPPKIAEMFQNLSPDQFPPRYRKLIEEYFRKANNRKEP
ncbi:MAG: hypothetical protein HY812_16645 [Planctomycetes bacterium]|nr:hypothetical protein [Planctomycetota bacterium]